MNDGTTQDVLARICAQTLADVAERRAGRPIQELRSRIADQDDPPRGFTAALGNAVGQGRLGLIAEIKQSSPSGGMIRPDFNAAQLALDYQAGGATCLSVLTDHAHFGGLPAHLRAARRAVALPVLRKDFMLDAWQIFESRAMGADCVLLIMAALTDSLALELEQIARDLDMDVLAEVHDRAELDRALGLRTALIGINNRNLKTLRTDLQTTLDLASHVPPDRILVAESGIRNHADVQRLKAAGAHCFLVGESLLRQPNVTRAAASLLGSGQ